MRVGTGVPANRVSPHTIEMVPLDQWEGEPGFLAGSKRDFANSLTAEVWGFGLGVCCAEEGPILHSQCNKRN